MIKDVAEFSETAQKVYEKNKQRKIDEEYWERSLLATTVRTLLTNTFEYEALNGKQEGTAIAWKLVSHWQKHVVPTLLLSLKLEVNTYTGVAKVGRRCWNHERCEHTAGLITEMKV